MSKEKNEKQINILESTRSRFKEVPQKRESVIVNAELA